MEQNKTATPEKEAQWMDEMSNTNSFAELFILHCTKMYSFSRLATTSRPLDLHIVQPFKKMGCRLSSEIPWNPHKILFGMNIEQYHEFCLNC